MTELLERIAECVRPELAPDVRLDQDGRVAEVADGDRTFSYTYDDHGDLVQVDDSELGASRFVYDEHRRLVQAHHPRQVATYRYNQDDRLVDSDCEGHRIRAGYDAVGRVTAIRHDDEVLRTYRYDDAGRVVEGRDGGVVTRYTFDDDGHAVRVEQLIDGAAAVVHLDYDGHGRRREVVPVGGPRIGYGWDESGRPAAITVDGHVAVEVGYDDENKVVRTRLANGLVEEARADPTDGRTVERVVRRDGATLLHRRYIYDAAGRIVDDGLRRFGYDEQSRVTTVRQADSGWEYGYDRSGNLDRVSRLGSLTASRDLRLNYDRDRLLGVSGEPVGASHDRLGALTGVGLDGVTWSWRYDAAGRAIQVRRGTRVTARLRYDHGGRLVLAQWTHDDAGQLMPGDRAAGAALAERYVYGPDDELLAVTDVSGAVLRVPLRTPWAVHAEALAGPGRARLRFLHTDDRGTLWLATGEDGDVIARYDYDAFGDPMPAPTNGAAHPDAPRPLFGGRQLVPGTGCYWFGSRWYHPRLRRFLTRDTWTAGPDDERLVCPALPGRGRPWPGPSSSPVGCAARACRAPTRSAPTTR